MTKPFDPKDNDTYVEKLSDNMVQDVHRHMFADQTTTESLKRAEDSVLRFAKASDLKLVSVKTLKCKTLVPMSLVNRYSLGVDSLTYSQKTPVMFDPKRERFVLLMDWRFARDMDLVQLAGAFDKDIRNCIEVYQDKEGGRHLALLYPTLDELRSDKILHGDTALRPFAALHEVYSNFRLSLMEGDKVILVRFDNSTASGYLMDPKSRDALEAVKASAMRLEFTVAFRFGKRCYLSRDGKTFGQKDVMFLDKASAQKKSEDDTIMRSLGMVKGDTLVLPYSDEQIDFLNAMQARLSSLHSDMRAFFAGCMAPAEKLDCPLGETSLPMMQLLIGKVDEKD